MKLQLTGPQLGQIRRAVVKVYEGAGASALDLLNQAVTDNLASITVFHYVSVPAPFDLQVGQLLARANGEGWLPSLLGAVQQGQPEATELQELLLSILATASARQVINVAAGGEFVAADISVKLEKLMPGSAILQLDTLQRRIRSVCRIDYADFSPPGIGTGFLIGPDLVLTNWHNLKRVIESPAAAPQLRFRFDLLNRVAAADNAGRVAYAKSGGTPLLRWSPAAGVELPGGGADEPNMQELDYAVVRLGESVADDLLPGGATRGYIGLKKTIPLAGAESALMVLQHPLRGELQFAIGMALGPNATGSRLKHTASTQDGSSGSPVFDAALGALALHNGSRSATARAVQKFNTAVPLAHIVADLSNHGVTEMLED